MLKFRYLWSHSFTYTLEKEQPKYANTFLFPLWELLLYICLYSGLVFRLETHRKKQQQLFAGHFPLLVNFTCQFGRIGK